MLSIPEIPCVPARRDDAAVMLPRLAAVLANLPALGDVLCQVRPSAPLPDSALARWMAVSGNAMPMPDHPWLHAMARVAGLRASADIDSDGPRECLEFVDMDGSALIRVWLLPDSDFYAWDRLLARHAVPVAPPRRQRLRGDGTVTLRCWRFGLRRWQAALVRFHLQRVAGLSLLGMSTVQASALARQRAMRLAGAVG